MTVRFPFTRQWILILITSMMAATAHAEMTVNIGGRIHVDAALYDEDVSELGSGTEFRRARAFASGVLADQWNYKLQLEFGDASVDMKDAFIQYTGLNIGKVKIGQFKMPFSLEEMTSSKYITFMERGSANAFATSRRIGVGLENSYGNRTWSAAIFGNEAQDNNADEGLGIAGRFTIAPQLSEGRFWHLGLAATYEEPETTDDDSGIRFRARPESHVTGMRMVNGGTIPNVSNIMKTGLEAAYVSGGLSVQSEYIRTSVDATGGDADYDGFYIYTSYFPWGGSRPYKNGVFGRVKANNTWEFALRYSTIDLSDTNGGEQDNITVGVNYYVTPHLRFMANLIRADVTGGANGDESPNIFQLRAAMDFK